MSIDDVRLKALRKQNPFLSSSAGDPWQNSSPHVESVNKNTFQGLLSLIDQKKNASSGGYSALVLGEVGSGKTHLLSRIHKYSINSGEYYFSYIEPFEDSSNVFRYLLREIIINLVRPHKKNSKKTYLHKLIAHIYVEMFAQRTQGARYQGLIEKLRDNPELIFEMNLSNDQFDIIEKKAYEYISIECPEISSEFLKVLFQYRDPSKRAIVINWLKGDMIDIDDAKKIGVRDRNIDNDTISFVLEQEARDFLKFLDTMLSRYNESLVVCFDRLENLSSRSQIEAFGRIVEFLVDTSGSMVPVVCFRGQQWVEKFRVRLNQHVTTRLENNKFLLEGCTEEQAIAIIKSRLETVTGSKDDLFPFDERRLREVFSGGLESPREVITQANHLLLEILETGLDKSIEGPPDKLMKEFEIVAKRISSDLDRYNPDSGRLLRAIDIMFGSGISGRISHKRKEQGIIVYVSITGKRVGFVVDNELHQRSVATILTEAADYLDKNKNTPIFYVRDARCEFPSPPHWKNTNDVLERFLSSGGQTLFLDSERVSKWYALALLSYAVKEGDTVIDDPFNGIRSITKTEFNTFVNNYLRNYDSDLFFEIIESVI